MGQTTVDLTELVSSVVASHRTTRGPLMVVLQEIQERLGYLDPDVVPLVAAELNLSRADVHGVATFYRDFHEQPHGEVTVAICRAEACQAMGSDELVSEVESAFGIRIGETTPDGAITLDHVFCLGNCALAPAVQINGRMHGRVGCHQVVDAVQGQSR